MSGKASIFPGNAHLAALLFSRDGGLDAPLSACQCTKTSRSSEDISYVSELPVCVILVFSPGVGLFGLLLQLESLLHKLVAS